jgi:hypothetical protein
MKTTVYLPSNICKLCRFWLFWFTCCRKILKWFGFPVFYAVLLCILTFWVPCCDACYDFRIQEMFGSSLPPVVCRMAHVLFMRVICICIVVSNTYCAVFLLFVLVICYLLFVICICIVVSNTYCVVFLLFVIVICYLLFVLWCLTHIVLCYLLFIICYLYLYCGV